MALSVPERIAQIAEHFAEHSAHGYSQPNRGTGSAETITLSDGSKVSVTNSDVDCSEMVRQCVNGALGKKAIAYMWTGNQDEQLKAQGFTRMGYSASKVQRGDVLWVKGHTGVALGGGKQADAHGDEVGGLTGPRKGDQTGSEIEIRSLRSWTYIYRWSGSGSNLVKADFKVTALTERNVRYEPSTARDEAVTGTLKPGQSVTCYAFTQGGKYMWGVYTGEKTGRTLYIALTEGVVVS